MSEHDAHQPPPSDLAARRAAAQASFGRTEKLDALLAQRFDEGKRVGRLEQAARIRLLEAVYRAALAHDSNSAQCLCCRESYEWGMTHKANLPPAAPHGRDCLVSAVRAVKALDVEPKT